MDALLDVAGTEPGVFSDGTGIFDFQSLQDLTAGRVGDRMEQAIESLVLGSHGIGIEGKLMDVNVEIVGGNF